MNQGEMEISKNGLTMTKLPNGNESTSSYEAETNYFETELPICATISEFEENLPN